MDDVRRDRALVFNLCDARSTRGLRKSAFGAVVSKVSQILINDDAFGMARLTQTQASVRCPSAYAL